MKKFWDNLLCRPFAVNGEGGHGYLLRLANANHMQGISALARMNGSKVKDYLINISIKTDQNGPDVPLNLSTLLESKGRRTRICPYCMCEKNPYLRGEWDKPVNLRCKEHRCILLDRCNSCSRPITHDRKHFDTCNCGQKFSRMPAQPIPGWVMKMEEKFAEAFSEPKHGSVILKGLKAARLLRSFAQAKAAGHVVKSGVMRTNGILASDDFAHLERCFQDSKVGFPNEYRWHFGVSGCDPLITNRLLCINEFQKVSTEVARIYSETVNPTTDLYGVPTNLLRIEATKASQDSA